MEASFIAIARGVTHSDLIAETTLIMAPVETSKLWRKVFTAHETGTLLNPDRLGRTYLDDHVEAQQKLRARHEKMKSSTPFEEKPYVCKPLTRETFKNLAGITRADFYTAAKRILDPIEGQGIPRVTIRGCKNQNVVNVKSWCHFRKWKNILIQELAARDPHKLGLWARDSDGYKCLNWDVWNKFKRNRGITKARWHKLYEVAGESWLNKKRSPNFKNMEANPKCDRLLRDWLKANLDDCVGQVVTWWVSQNTIKKRLVIPKQDTDDQHWISSCITVAGFIDFRFIPGNVDEPVGNEIVESLVKYITSADWTPGLKSVPAWMIVSDICNHSTALEFMSALMRRHPDTFQIVPSFYFPCPAEDLPYDKEIESKRTSNAIYVDYFTCTKLLPRWKVFRCPMLPPDSRRYTVKPKEWCETSFELNRGELRMEVYLSFLDLMGSAGGMVLSFFGGLKPIAAALMRDYNVFCYQDSAFMHNLESLIDRVQQLQLADFAEEGDKDNETREGVIRPERADSPALQLVSSEHASFPLVSSPCLYYHPFLHS